MNIKSHLLVGVIVLVIGYVLGAKYPQLAAKIPGIAAG